MTDNDKKLIETAKNLDCIDWGCVSSLIEKADTVEAKSILKGIEVRLYHQEEGRNI
jgi:hypothetical protein